MLLQAITKMHALVMISDMTQKTFFFFFFQFVENLSKSFLILTRGIFEFIKANRIFNLSLKANEGRH